MFTFFNFLLLTIRTMMWISMLPFKWHCIALQSQWRIQYKLLANNCHQSNVHCHCNGSDGNSKLETTNPCHLSKTFPLFFTYFFSIFVALLFYLSPFSPLSYMYSSLDMFGEHFHWQNDLCSRCQPKNVFERMGKRKTHKFHSVKSKCMHESI